MATKTQKVGHRMDFFKQRIILFWECNCVDTALDSTIATSLTGQVGLTKYQVASANPAFWLELSSLKISRLSSEKTSWMIRSPTAPTVALLRVRTLSSRALHSVRRVLFAASAL